MKKKEKEYAKIPCCLEKRHCLKMHTVELKLGSLREHAVCLIPGRLVKKSCFFLFRCPNIKL